jgi:hypothetical protein
MRRAQVVRAHPYATWARISVSSMREGQAHSAGPQCLQPPSGQRPTTSDLGHEGPCGKLHDWREAEAEGDRRSQPEREQTCGIPTRKFERGVQSFIESFAGTVQRDAHGHIHRPSPTPKLGSSATREHVPHDGLALGCADLQHRRVVLKRGSSAASRMAWSIQNTLRCDQRKNAASVTRNGKCFSGTVRTRRPSR